MLIPDFEAEVRGNILKQPLLNDADSGTVADLNLPHEFLTRLADRMLRASFYDNFRTVVATAQELEALNARDAAARAAGHDATPARGDGKLSVPGEVDVQQTDVSESRIQLWSTHDESSLVVASFRSPSCGAPVTPVADVTAETLASARRVAHKCLAREGFLEALARVIAVLGAERVGLCRAPSALLSQAGVPVDLLAFVRPEFARAEMTPDEIIRVLAARFTGGESIERLTKSLKRRTFQPAQSLPGFRPTSDSGRDTIDLMRMHATRATYFASAGDGGNLDLMLGVLGALPNTPAIIVAKADDAEPLRSVIAHASRAAPTTIVAQPLVVSQWAADNAKSGTLDGKPAHLAPRFATRGEYLPMFVPGDDLAVEAKIIRSACSPLLFQGGNLLMVDDLPRSRRVLLLGEAEVYRNRALGFTTDQVLAFFRAEFGADVIEVLPAASYHIDHEVTVRSTSDRTIAFVPDSLSASKLIVERSLARLVEVGRWNRTHVERVLADLGGSRTHNAMYLVWQMLELDRTHQGAFALSFADALSTGPADSGVGNLQCFLLALDLVAFHLDSGVKVAGPNIAALYRSFRQRDADRAKIRTLLTLLGWKIVPVPALPEDSRGINPLNGIHTPNAYLMPAYGGLFATIDGIAAETFRAALDPEIAVISIPSAESQRREGALHCALACYGH